MFPEQKYKASERYPSNSASYFYREWQSYVLKRITNFIEKFRNEKANQKCVHLRFCFFPLVTTQTNENIKSSSSHTSRTKYSTDLRIWCGSPCKHHPSIVLLVIFSHGPFINLNVSLMLACLGTPDLITVLFFGVLAKYLLWKCNIFLIANKVTTTTVH